MATTSTSSQICNALQAAGLPAPSPSFLSSILSNSSSRATATPPLPALIATTKHRVLSADFTTSPSVLAAGTASFPTNVHDPSVQSTHLETIPVQVVGIEDISRSKWEQIEEIEERERGERMRGRVVVRIQEEEDADGNIIDVNANGPASGASSSRSAGSTHRLVLQDVKGRKVYAIELKSVPKIDLSLPIGTKLMLRNATVARGVVLLEPGSVTILGGKIEGLHRAWTENRKRMLMEGLPQQGDQPRV